MLSTNIQKHLNTLSGEIGSRFSGTENNRKAAGYIEQVFLAGGLAVERQEYACSGWECQYTELALDGLVLDARANVYSPSCSVTTQVVPLGTLPELEAAQIEGEIALLYGDLSESPYSPKSWFLISERETQIIGLLEQKKPAAVLTVQGRRPGSLIRIFEDAEFGIPSATISARSGLALIQQPGAAVRLKIESRAFPAVSWNVVGRKPDDAQEAVRESQKVVLMAHYDTKIDTPGAWDNASGVSAMLAVVENLEKGRFPFDLEFVAFGNEEYLPIGDDEYVRRAGEESFGQVLAAINMDGIGQALAANSITLIGGSEEFQRRLADLTTAYPDIVWVEPWPQSNHSTFAFRGVPSVAFSSKGGVPLDHWEDDTLEWIDPARVERVSALVLEIIEMLCHRSDAWTRPVGA